MLECIKFGDCKIKKIQTKYEWFVSVCHIGIVLGMGSDTIKGIVRQHLPPQYKFSRKKKILMTLMMVLNYLLQYLVHAGSYYVQHILIDMKLFSC